MRKITGLILTVFLLIMAVPAQAQAAKISFTKDAVLTAYKKPVREYFIVAGLSKRGKVLKLKSNNKKVLTVLTKYEDDMDGHVICMKAKKAGKAKVSFTAKIGKTSKKFTCDVTVKKYTSPFRSIKVSGKSITSRMKKSNIVTLDYSRPKEKVTLKLKKGWEIETMVFDNGDWKEDAILNDLRFEAERGELALYLVNAGTGQSEICYVRWK